MSIDLFHETGIPLDEQTFTWRDLVRTPISKVDIDAFTRVRIILMNGVESEQNSFLHALARASSTERAAPRGPSRPSPCST